MVKWNGSFLLFVLSTAQCVTEIFSSGAPGSGCLQWQSGFSPLIPKRETEQQMKVLNVQAKVLIVEAILENKDIGFVQQGQEAEIKVHTFLFTQY